MKKRRKDAIKDICNNTFVVGKFREIFCMYDYDADEVRKLMKVMIKDFIKQGNDDPEKVDFIQAAKSRGRFDIVNSLIDDDDDEDDDDSDYVEYKVVQRNNKRKKLDKFFK